MTLGQRATRKSSRPPNYMSRSVQLRLFMLVAAFMFVLVAIEEAGKPKYYEWMWRGAQRLEAAGGPLDAGPAAADAAGASDLAPPDSPAATAGREGTGPERVARDAWEFIVSSLQDREARDLQDALLHIRRGRPPDAELLAALVPLEQWIGARWNEYLSTARDSLRVPAETRDMWLTQFRQLEEEWFRAASPYLVAWLAGQSPADPALPRMLAAESELQAVLERRLLQQVEDNTVFRLHEAPLWFRLFEGLQQAPPAAPAATPISYVQLLRQPKEYRGRVVRISGEVREARRVTAPENPLGIAAYYVLWLKPDGGTAPLVAYALELPPGFPPVADRSRGEPPTKLRLTVELSGLFFKLLTYQAQRSVESAPLILALEPKLSVDEPTATGPGSFVYVLVLAAAVGACSILALRMRTGSHPRPELPDALDLPAPRASTSHATRSPDTAGPDSPRGA